ncbi:2669_t:CDS:2, partial [Ambispora gerdemannii]
MEEPDKEQVRNMLTSLGKKPSEEQVNRFINMAKSAEKKKKPVKVAPKKKKASNTPATRHRRKKILKQAKGYFGSKRKLFKTAKEQVIKGHPVKPDKKFASPLVSQLINKVMKNGEKRKATQIVYQAAQLIEKNTSSPFLTVLEGALVNIKPVIEMKSRKIVEGAQEKKTTNPMYEKLAEEISNDYNKSGEAVKRKETLYKEAESGRRGDNKLPDSVSPEVIKTFLAKVKEKKENKIGNNSEKTNLNIGDLDELPTSTKKSKKLKLPLSHPAEKLVMCQQAFVKSKEKHLIKLDIDGTSTNPDFSTLNQKLKVTLQKLVKQGHKICFTTGRNYLSALPFYQEVGLDTFLVTYNGAYINNPSEKAQEQIVVNPMANEVIKSILAEPIIKQNLCNVMIDKIDRTTISTSDDIYYQEIFFNGNPYTKGDIWQLLGGKDALQLVLEFPNNEGMLNDILAILRSKYSAGITFYFGSKLKAKNPGEKILVPDPDKAIIKIRNKFATSYYNIPLSHTIAFGNDINDIELMHTVGRGIAMADSIPHLKAYAYGITDFGVLNSDEAENLQLVADDPFANFQEDIKKEKTQTAI